MSAAELRQAAETLRARANDTTPGPWVVLWQDAIPDDPTSEEGYWVAGADRSTVAVTCEDYKELPPRDSAYIATVQPAIGEQLAFLLYEGASTIETLERIGSAHQNEGVSPHLHRIARLINGGAA